MLCRFVICSSLESMCVVVVVSVAGCWHQFWGGPYCSGMLGLWYVLWWRDV